VEGPGGHTAGVGPVTVVMDGYWARPERLAVSNLSAKSVKSLRLRMLWRLCSSETLLEGLAQDLQHMAAELRQFIEEEHAVVRQRHFARHRPCPPPISPTSERVWCGARNGRVVTKAVRSPSLAGPARGRA
jgi:hypothetical protein